MTIKGSRPGRASRLALACTAVTALCAAVIPASSAFAVDDDDTSDVTFATSTTITGIVGSSSVNDDSGIALAKAILATKMEEDEDTTISADALTFTTVDISGQMQKKAYWCAPASVRATLTAFGVTKSQSTLAGALGTTSNGTSASAMPGVLNSYQSDNDYIDTKSTSSAKNLFARVKEDVKNWDAPLIPAIDGRDLPLWNANGYEGDHAITLYGYGSDHASLKYFDPVDLSALYGRHTVKAKYVYIGMNDDYDGNLNNELAY